MRACMGVSVYVHLRCITQRFWLHLERFYPFRLFCVHLPAKGRETHVHIHALSTPNIWFQPQLSALNSSDVINCTDTFCKWMKKYYAWGSRSYSLTYIHNTRIRHSISYSTHPVCSVLYRVHFSPKREIKRNKYTHQKCKSIYVTKC